MASVEITGLDKVNEMIAGLNRPLTLAMGEVGNIGVAGIKSNLEGNPLGLAPLAESTIATKGSSQILVDKGIMKNATFWRIMDALTLHLFNNDPKAAWHVEGTAPYDIIPRFRGSEFLSGQGGRGSSRRAGGRAVRGSRSRRNPFNRFLRFTGSAGEEVFARGVHHPGLKKRDFMVIRDEVFTEMLRAVLVALGFI